MNNWIALIAGGILGTSARFLLSTAVAVRMGTGFPYGTMLVNIVGCLLVGFFDVLIERKCTVPANVRLFLIVGFCGAFTTFSAYMLECYNLIKAGAMLNAFVYVLGSVILGLVFLKVGMILGKLV